MRKQDASRGAPAWVLHLEPQAAAGHAGLGGLCSRALVRGPAGPSERLLRGEGRRSSRGGQGLGAQRVKAATGLGAPSAGSGVPGRAVRSAVRVALASARRPRAIRSARLPPPRSVVRRLRVQGTAWLFWALVTAASLQARLWGWSCSPGPRAPGSTAQSRLSTSGLCALAPRREWPLCAGLCAG